MQNNTHLPKYRFFPLIVMVYVTLSLASSSVSYYVTDTKIGIMTASALILPFRYFILDIIAEVYGFYVAKRLILYLILCWYIFSLIVTGVIHLPTPSYWQHQPAYELVFGKTLEATTGSMIGILIGGNINIYCLSKWKALTKGKYFWLRSLGSSMIGETIQYVIALPMIYIGVLSANKILHLVILDSLVQFLILILLAFPAGFIAFLLKRAEKLDTYDKTIFFNPLRLKD